MVKPDPLGPPTLDCAVGCFSLAVHPAGDSRAHCPRAKVQFCLEFRLQAATCGCPSKPPEGGTPNGGGQCQDPPVAVGRALPDFAHRSQFVIISINETGAGSFGLFGDCPGFGPWNSAAGGGQTVAAHHRVRRLCRRLRPNLLAAATLTTGKRLAGTLAPPMSL